MGLPRCRGAIALQVVLFLPVMLALLAIVFDLGAVFLARYQLQTAVDFAALAAAQDVDLTLLADGKRVLLAGPAKEDATEMIEANLAGTRGGGVAPEVSVTVHNPSTAEPDRDAWTGKPIWQPTVCVRARIPVTTLTAVLIGQSAIVEAHADASVLERR